MKDLDFPERQGYNGEFFFDQHNQPDMFSRDYINTNRRSKEIFNDYNNFITANVHDSIKPHGSMSKNGHKPSTRYNNDYRHSNNNRDYYDFEGEEVIDWEYEIRREREMELAAQKDRCRDSRRSYDNNYDFDNDYHTRVTDFIPNKCRHQSRNYRSRPIHRRQNVKV